MDIILLYIRNVYLPEDYKRIIITVNSQFKRPHFSFLKSRVVLFKKDLCSESKDFASYFCLLRIFDNFWKISRTRLGNLSWGLRWEIEGCFDLHRWEFNKKKMRTIFVNGAQKINPFLSDIKQFSHIFGNLGQPL